LLLLPVTCFASLRRETHFKYMSTCYMRATKLLHVANRTFSLGARHARSCDAACRVLRKHVPRMPVTHHAMPDRTEQAGPKQGLSQLRNSGWSKPGSGPAVKPLRK
jgi:hypothetical protein